MAQPQLLLQQQGKLVALDGLVRTGLAPHLDAGLP